MRGTSLIERGPVEADRLATLSLSERTFPDEQFQIDKHSDWTESRGLVRTYFDEQFLNDKHSDWTEGRGRQVSGKKVSCASLLHQGAPLGGLASKVASKLAAGAKSGANIAGKVENWVGRSAAGAANNSVTPDAILEDVVAAGGGTAAVGPAAMAAGASFTLAVATAQSAARGCANRTAISG